MEVDVVVIRIRNEHPLLRAGPRIVQAPRVLGRNEPVALARHHQQRRPDVRGVRQRVEGMLEQQGHREDRVLLPGDAAQAVERGNQHHRPHRPARGELYRDPAAETAPEDHDAIRVDVLALRKPVVDGECVRGERFFARTPFAQPEAPIVDGRERPRREHRRIVHLPGHLLRVAAEVDHQTSRLRLLRGVPEPAVQLRSVVRRDSNLGRARQELHRVPIAVRKRRAQKDELLLKQVEHRAQPDVYREPGEQQRQHRPLHHFHPVRSCTAAPELTYALAPGTGRRLSPIREADAAGSASGTVNRREMAAGVMGAGREGDHIMIVIVTTVQSCCYQFSARLQWSREVPRGLIRALSTQADARLGPPIIRGTAADGVAA